MKAIASNPILVFPSSTTSSLEFLTRCKSIGEVVYGASSLRTDPNEQFYDRWDWLPLITEVNFKTMLLDLIDTYQISRIFCPIPVAHKCIEDILRVAQSDCRLLPSPFDSELLRYQRLHTRALNSVEMAETMIAKKVSLSTSQVKSILNHTDSVWGQCGELKLGALIAVMSDAPQGDVVEIGAFLGKSASALTLLAKWHGTGNVIIVDPWAAASAVQKDAPDYVQQLSLGSYWDAIADQFMVNLIAIADGGFNYIRDSAENARAKYGNGTVQSSEFGMTTCCGSIAVLHIDGNHDYDAVSLDSKLWLPLVAPNGWVIFDDYSWAHGNGPQRVGDQVLSEFQSSIQTSFVCDGALFIKFNSCPR
jgi:hypothetical protein